VDNTQPYSMVVMPILIRILSHKLSGIDVDLIVDYCIPIVNQINIMQVRWNYKLQPNNEQDALMSEWTVTLRKHRNYSLREREEGWNTNNRDADKPVSYAWGAFCDLATRAEYGSCCPLTCPVVKHGVMPQQLSDEQLLKKSGKLGLVWDSASGVQSKRTTQLRHESEWYGRIDSDVLQRNLAKLDAAFLGFWKHERGFPAYRKTSNFNSFEYKPGRCKFTVLGVISGKHRYSRVYMPGIGLMRYFDSRPIPENADIRTVTIKREADGWYISVVLNLPEALPDPIELEDCTGVNGLDRGINKLIASSDGSFVENPKFATNRKTKRLLRIRQRRVNRKRKGSKNRAKAGKAVAKLHRKVAQKRKSYQWNAANKEVKKADCVAVEDLNIKGMKSRCKPKKQNGRFMPNGQSAKRGLNRAISDASWGELGSKIAWLCIKSGKQFIEVPAHYTSQECRACGHKSPNNRDEEKFICEACGHIDHADTQAGRTIAVRVGLKFVSNRHKKPTHKSLVPTGGLSESNALVCNDAASNGKRYQAGNPTSKAVQLDLFESGIPERIA
jgi:putative transposase